ncbi:MAG: OadG family protein, partial [Anaerolineae bacterium]
MDNELFLALFITAAGMTLLFLSLGLFYGLLSLMTRLFEDQPAGSGGLFAKPKPPAEVATTEPEAPDEPDRLR